MSDIGSLLVLIGRNGAGKSNILKAIEWAAKTVSGNTPLKLTSFFDTNEGSITFEFSLKDSLYKYSLIKQQEVPSKKENRFEETLSKKLGSDWLEIIRRKNETVTLGSEFGPIETSTLNISAQTSCFIALQSILPEGSEFRIISEGIVRFFSSIRYYPLSSKESDETLPLGTVVLQEKDYQKWISDGFPDKGDTFSLLYKILHLKLTQDDRFEELQALVGEHGLGLLDHIDIQSISFGKPKIGTVTGHVVTNPAETPDVHALWFHPLNQGGKFFSFDDLSFGTKRVISLLVAMLFDSSSVSLIEQPEDGIHSGLVNKLAELLEAYSYKAQFLVASHSITILNRLSPDAVRIIEMANGITQARALSQPEMKAAKNYLEKDGTFFEFLRTIQED